MRRGLAILLAACAATAGVLLATSPHKPHTSTPHLAIKPSHRLTACASRDCDSYRVALDWTPIPWAFTTTGYDVFLNGSQVGTATGTSHTFMGLGCGRTLQLGVQAHDSGSDVSQMYTTSYTTPACSQVHVGAPTPSGVRCTRTLNPGANVSNVLSSASPGSTICLNSGGWSSVTLNGVAPPSPGVTLAATPGQTVVVPGFEVTGRNTQNLTIEGFNITTPSQVGSPPNGIELVCGISGGVTLKYNTIEDQPKGVGIEEDATGCGSGHNQNGVTAEYNQIDHVGGGFQIDGGGGTISNFTVSHNVIGPEIGYQDTNTATDAQHYIEIGGPTNTATITYNAFEGPMDPNYVSAGLHDNAIHLNTRQSNVTIDNNIMWHTQNKGNASVLIQDQSDNITVENNLDVEDPACNAVNSPCDTNPYEIDAPHGLMFAHNTVVNAAWGMTLGRVCTRPTCTPGSYPNGQNMTAEYNIAEPHAGDTGETNYGLWKCASSCTTQNNTSADSSASTVLGGTGNVINWTAHWANTSWTPVRGPGYQPPPSGLYQPTGLAISGAGYQGQIGP